MAYTLAKHLEDEVEEVEDTDEEEDLGSTFGTSADSFTEAPESARHYAWSKEYVPGLSDC